MTSKRCLCILIKISISLHLNFVTETELKTDFLTTCLNKPAIYDNSGIHFYVI